MITLCCPRPSTPSNSLLHTPTRALWHYSSDPQTVWFSTIPQEVINTLMTIRSLKSSFQTTMIKRWSRRILARKYNLPPLLNPQRFHQRSQLRIIRLKAPQSRLLPSKSRLSLKSSHLGPITLPSRGNRLLQTTLEWAWSTKWAPRPSQTRMTSASSRRISWPKNPQRWRPSRLSPWKMKKMRAISRQAKKREGSTWWTMRTSRGTTSKWLRTPTRMFDKLIWNTTDC